MRETSRDKWIQVLETVAKRQPDEVEAEWKWLMDELGLEPQYFLAVYEVVRQGRWRQAENPAGYVKTAARREASGATRRREKQRRYSEFVRELKGKLAQNPKAAETWGLRYVPPDPATSKVKTGAEFEQELQDLVDKHREVKPEIPSLHGLIIVCPGNDYEEEIPVSRMMQRDDRAGGDSGEERFTSEDVLDSLEYRQDSGAAVKDKDGVWRWGAGPGAYYGDRLRVDRGHAHFKRRGGPGSVGQDIPLTDIPRSPDAPFDPEFDGPPVDDDHPSLQREVTPEEWAKWADAAGLSDWEKKALEYKTSGISREKALAAQPNEVARKALQAAWKSVERTGLKRLRRIGPSGHRDIGTSENQRLTDE